MAEGEGCQHHSPQLLSEEVETPSAGRVLEAAAQLAVARTAEHRALGHLAVPEVVEREEQQTREQQAAVAQPGAVVAEAEAERVRKRASEAWEAQGGTTAAEAEAVEADSTPPGTAVRAERAAPESL